MNFKNQLPQAIPPFASLRLHFFIYFRTFFFATRARYWWPSLRTVLPNLGTLITDQDLDRVPASTSESGPSFG